MSEKVHFVGIGGIGMSALARILLSMGISVTGSDIHEGRMVSELKGMGIKIYLGHRPWQVSDASLVVYSSAIRPDNPELEEARRKGIPVIHRGDMLARIMEQKNGVAVAGSHGKTTTTSLVAMVLMEAGWEPTVIVGGRLISMGTNACLGSGEFVVAEADESDGSFLRLRPYYAVVTNVDREHLDHYGDYKSLVEAFHTFLSSVRGEKVVCVDDPVLRSMSDGAITYGFGEDAMYSVRNMEKRGRCRCFIPLYKGEELGEVVIGLSGWHNIQNSLGALALCLEMGVKWDTAVEALGRFPGVERRLTVRGEAKGIMVVDDYGHHPTEIKCTLQAASESWPERRLIVFFQPHRYTRTKALLEEFWEAFSRAHQVWVTEVYSAGESPNGVTGMDVYRGIKEKSCPGARYLPDIKEAPISLAKVLKEGDLLLTLGAGDVWKVGEALLQLLGGFP